MRWRKQPQNTSVGLASVAVPAKPTTPTDPMTSAACIDETPQAGYEALEYVFERIAMLSDLIVMLIEWMQGIRTGKPGPEGWR